MGKSEEEASMKTEKGSPARKEQTDIHLYPHWTSFQAYHGPGVPLPQPYFNSAVTAGHVHPPHMWAPQQLFAPPYGVPYPTVYSQGVVFAHPAVPVVGTPFSTELLTKSSENIDQSPLKKLKRSDGLVVPVGNNIAEVAAERSVHEPSQSSDNDIDVSSDGSNGNTGAGSLPAVEAYANSNGMSGITVVPANVGSLDGKTEPIALCAAAGLPIRVSMQDERQLKRERRKQANRESARRSRLKKEAEIEELMKRYESVKVENLSLKSEINRLTQDSEKVRLENDALMEKLNNPQLGQPEKLVPYRISQSNGNLDS